jgi:hypothetical protein
LDRYRSRQWYDFKNEVIKIDRGQCTCCGRSKADGVVLQVHHREYLPGRKPWEYPYELCFTLCSGCHAAIHGIIPPKFGWSHAGWDDLGSLDGTCDCCGQSIRYVFLIDHPSWHPLEVGEECCGNLTSEQAARGGLDSERRYRARLKTFLSSTRWCSLLTGIYIIRHEGRLIQIHRELDGFHIRIDGVEGRLRFDHLDAAKTAIFQGMENGRIQRYVAKYRKHA